MTIITLMRMKSLMITSRKMTSSGLLHQRKLLTDQSSDLPTKMGGVKRLGSAPVIDAGQMGGAYELIGCQLMVDGIQLQ